MACLLKAPDGTSKGCIIFTTQERDRFIKVFPDIRNRVECLKKRFLVGLHHNWHDYQFRYDDLFDFSMAGHGDLIEVDGRNFPYVPLDACNFAPMSYSEKKSVPPFWDILYVARAVAFKGISEFFQTIRELYDQGLSPRVLFICPTPPTIEIPGISDLRGHFEALFNESERERVTFLAIDWDYPFPLDSETLAFFYRSSRIFFHSAPDERRCRTAAYAWANRMPVVANSNVASILPTKFHRPPFLHLFNDQAGMAGALIRALGMASNTDEEWPDVVAEFSAQSSADRLDKYLHALAATRNEGFSSKSINIHHLDIRLGRHHGVPAGRNKIDGSLSELCAALKEFPDSDLEGATLEADPELALDLALRKLRSSPEVKPNHVSGRRHIISVMRGLFGPLGRRST